MRSPAVASPLSDAVTAAINARSSSKLGLRVAVPSPSSPFREKKKESHSEQNNNDNRDDIEDNYSVTSSDSIDDEINDKVDPRSKEAASLNASSLKQRSLELRLKGSLQIQNELKVELARTKELLFERDVVLNKLDGDFVAAAEEFQVMRRMVDLQEMELVNLRKIVKYERGSKVAQFSKSPLRVPSPRINTPLRGGREQQRLSSPVRSLFTPPATKASSTITFNELTGLCEAYESQKSVAQVTIQELNDVHKKMKEATMDAADDGDSLREQFDDAVKRVHISQDNLDILRARLQEIRSDASSEDANLRKSVDASNSSGVLNELEDLVSFLQSELKRAQTDLSLSKATLLAREDEAARIKGEMISARENNESLCTQLFQVNSDLMLLKNREGEFDASKYAATISKLESEIHFSREREESATEIMRKMWDHAQEAQSKLDACLVETASLRNTLGSAIQAKVDARSVIFALEAELQLVSRLYEEERAVNDSTSEGNSSVELGSLRIQHASLQSEQVRLVKELAVKEDRIAALSEEISEWKDRATSAEQSTENGLKDISRVIRQQFRVPQPSLSLTTFSEVCSSLSSLAESWTEEKERSLLSTEDMASKARGVIDILNTEISLTEAIQIELDQREDNEMELDRALEDANEEIKGLSAELENVLLELEKITASEESKEKQIKELSSELSNALLSLDGKEEEIRGLSAELESVLEMAEGREEEVQGLGARLEEALVQLEGKESEVRTLGTELELALTELDRVTSGAEDDETKRKQRSSSMIVDSPPDE